MNSLIILLLMNRDSVETLKQVEEQSRQKLEWKTYMHADAITAAFSVGWMN